MLFAMSDIHGYFDLFCYRLEQLERDYSFFQSYSKDMLILLGDYIDEGPDSCKVLEKIKSLQDEFPEKVIALKGNHDQWFLNYIFKRKSVPDADTNLITTSTFLVGAQAETLAAMAPGGRVNDPFEFYEWMRRRILKNYGELIKWYEKLPCYYKTEHQIFVHAGIDEDAKDMWEWGTSEEIFLNKYPATQGSFYKDIIAGHVGTASISGNKSFHDIYWDGKSHYYIDGTASFSKSIPVLAYDEEKGKYYSLHSDGLRPISRCAKQE